MFLPSLVYSNWFSLFQLFLVGLIYPYNWILGQSNYPN